MAHRFIIDDSTGALYSDFTCRRLTSAADILKSERGLSPTLEIYLVNVATDTRAVTGQTLTNADLDIILGSAGKMPDEGIIKIGWNDSGSLYESGYVDVKNLSDDAIAAAFNSTVSPVTDAEGINVDNIGEGKWLLTMKKVGAISGNPTFDVEGCNPPSAVEVSSIRTGDSNTKGQWIISIAQSPVASISGGSFSAVTSGSFSGLSASISLNTTAMIASISRGIKDFELSITHNNQLLHRSPVSIHESLDPTTAGTLIISSPSLFTLGSNAVNQGETIALSGGLTYDGTTLAAPFLPLAGGTMTGDALFGQDVKAVFGSTLEIYYDGSHSRIREIGTGELRLQGTNLRLFSAGGENYLTATENGAVSLFYDAEKKFETSNDGVVCTGLLQVNGSLNCSGTLTTFDTEHVVVTDPIISLGGTPTTDSNKDVGMELNYYNSGSAKKAAVVWDDSEQAIALFSDATNSSEVFSGTLADLKTKDITLSAGTLQLDSAYAIQWGNGNNRIFGSSGNNYIRFDTNGTEAARFDSSGHFLIPDDNKIKLGDDEDLEIYNAANNNSVIKKTTTGGLFLLNDSTTYIQGTFGEDLARFIKDGAVQLYYDGSKTFETISGGCQITGSLGIGGTPTRELEVTGTGNVYARITAPSASDSAALELNNTNLLWSLKADDTDSDAFKIINNNGTALTIDANKNVGIGGTPSVSLHVKKDSSTLGPVLRLDNPSTTNLSQCGIEFVNTSTGVPRSAIYSQRVDNGYNSELVFYTSDTDTLQERVRIDHDGNLGIGGTPSEKFSIINTGGICGMNLKSASDNLCFIDFGDSDDGNIGGINYNNSNDTLNLRAGNANRLTVTSSGNVGIGTTSPGAELDLRGDMRLDSSGNTDRSIYFRNQSSLGQIKSDAGLQFQVGVSGSPAVAMTITEDNRNVGIGTTSPDSKIEISGTDSSTTDTFGLKISNEDITTNSNGGILFKNYDNHGAWIRSIRTGSANGKLSFGTNSGAGIAESNISERMVIDHNGNVGIGTTAPDFALDVGGDIGIDDKIYHNGDHNTYIGFTGSDTISLRTGGTDVITLDSSQRCGIGTTAPNALLHVKSTGNGEIEIERASGALINLQAQSTRGVIGTDSNNELHIKTNATSQMSISTSGDVEILTDGKGLILNSPDGTAYKITVANDGTVTSTAV